MPNNIVCGANVKRHYVDNPELVKKYTEIVKNGRCPFCPGNIEDEVVGETEHWTIVLNQFPYKGSRLHLLVIPKQHRISLVELSREEWADFFVAIRVATERYVFLADGYGMAVREKEIGGATLYHVHFHIIVPEVGKQGPVSIYFGIG